MANKAQAHRTQIGSYANERHRIRKEPMSHDNEPLAVTIAEVRRLSGLSNTRIYKAINAGLLDTTRVFGRRLVIYASLKKALGIRPPGEQPIAAAPGLAGGKIKDPPGRRRKPVTSQDGTQP
jgi:hypothetical protein